MFNSQNQIKIVDRIDHLAKSLTAEEIEALYQSESDLMLESVSLEDLENTLLFQCEPVPQMMLEAFKSKASQLAIRVKKFANQLERQTPNLTCGEVEIGKPRKAGAVAVQVAKIPLSDGQSVSIAFHAPDNDPLKINANDTLIAFRFLLNSRDVTHAVAAKGGQDVSLKEATTKLGALAEKNSDKFAAAQSKKKADAAELEMAQEKAQKLEEQAAQLNTEATDLELKNDEVNARIKRLKTQIATQNEIQAELRKQLTKKKASSASSTAKPEADSNIDPVVALFRNPKLKAAADIALKVEGGKRAFSTLGTLADIDVNGAKGMDRSLFVSNFAGRIKTLHKNGNQDAVDAILTMVASYNDVAPKAAITARNGIWKLGRIQNIEVPVEQVAEQSQDDNNVSGDKLYWYGLRARPYGMGTTPNDYQPVKVIDDEEAAKQFAHLDFRMVRHGAIAYDQALPAGLAEQFELPLLLDKGDHEVAQNTKEMQRIVKLALDDYMLDEDLDFYTQEKLNELKARSFKSSFSKQLREQDEFTTKSQLPEKFKKWNELVDQVTPDIIQSVAEAESFIGTEDTEQLNNTQKRMMFISNAEERLSNIESLSPKERKGAVMLASRAIDGITKTPRKGEGAQGQAARIAKQIGVIKNLQGESYKSLDEQFKNVPQIKAFLTENNIPYRKLGATRKSLIESIIGYRDRFYDALNSIVSKNELQQDVMVKFERGEAIPLEDVEQGFGGASVYRMGDTALSKELNSPVVPAEDQQGEEYQRVDRLITAITNGEYPDLSHYSNQEVFAKYFEYSRTTMIDIKYIDGSKYLRQHEKLDENEAKVINTHCGGWFVDAILSEAEQRGLPDLNNTDDSLLRSGAFSEAEREHYKVIGTIGQNDAAVVNVITGQVVDGQTGLSGADAIASAKALNEQRTKQALDKLYDKLMSGTSIDELAASKSTRIASFSEEMLQTLNGFEVAFDKVAQESGSFSQGQAVLRENAESFIHLFDGTQFNLDELTDEQREAMIENYGIGEVKVITHKGKQHIALGILMSRAYLTTKAVRELWKLLGAGTEITSDEADEANKGKTEEEKQLLALDPNEFTFGAIYDAEGWQDGKTITSRIRAFITQCKKQGKLPQDLKISVKNQRGGYSTAIIMRITDLPESVQVNSDAALQSAIDNDGSLVFGQSRYSDELTNLVKYIEAYVGQFDSISGDAYGDYGSHHAVYGNNLQLDAAFSNQRWIQELESFTELHKNGDEADKSELDVNAIREYLDASSTLQLEQLEEFTSFKIQLGKQQITFPNGKTKSKTINDESDVEWVIDEFHDELARALEEKAVTQLESLTNWQSERVYYGQGFQGQLNIHNSINTNRSNSDSINGLYGRSNLTAAIGTRFVRIYPVVKSGEFKFAAYSNDSSKHFGDFTDHNELEMLCVSALELTAEQPETESSKEMEYTDQLKIIRDYTGTASQEQLEQYQAELEAAYSYFQESGTYPEHESLMEAAFANYVALQDQVAA